MPTIKAEKVHILKFRPFRIVKGQVIVTSYMGWRRVAIHTHNGYKVELSSNLDCAKNAHCINSKGEKLYYPSEEVLLSGHIIINRCYDCEGVPTFSHITEKSLGKSEYRHLFNPLYTNDVVREFHKMNELLKVNFIKTIK